MGQAVIGGLIASTILTLLVVPVLYALLDDLKQKLAGPKGSEVVDKGLQ